MDKTNSINNIVKLSDYYKNIHIRMPVYTYNRVKMLADYHGMSVNEFINKLVTFCIKSK